MSQLLVQEMKSDDIKEPFLFDNVTKSYGAAWNWFRDFPCYDYKVYIHIIPKIAIYVGQTRQSLKERWQNGNAYKHNQSFYNAIKKYGWNNIAHILYKENLKKEQADELEKELIHFYSTYEAFTGLYCLNIRDNWKI